MYLKSLNDIEDLDIPAVLRGNLTKSDGDVVLSMTLLNGFEERAITRKKDSVNDWVLRCAVQRRREERQKNGVKNLHESEEILKSSVGSRNMLVDEEGGIKI